MIKSVYKDEDGVTCIETYIDKDGGSNGYAVKETYNEIRAKLSRTSVIL